MFIEIRLFNIRQLSVTLRQDTFQHPLGIKDIRRYMRIVMKQLSLCLESLLFVIRLYWESCGIGT